MTEKDITVIRDLAKRYMEMAASEKQQRMNTRMKATNDLQLTRPPVLIDEIPWHQMHLGDELTCVCEDKRLHHIEFHFRSALYRWKHFKADTLFEPFWRVRMAYDNTGMGLSAQEEVIRVDAPNNIMSHKYHDILEDEEALEQMKMPAFTARPDRDEASMNFYTEVLGDAMPVKLCGHDYLYCAPWDIICRWRGVEPILIDMYDRPEYLHKIMQRYTDAIKAQLDFVEQNLRVDNNPANLHCTPAYISGLAEDGWKATWFRGMAQMFSTVSPAMHTEFELDYMLPIAERFAYTYYGCCEPLDNKLEVIEKIPNLRKIGVSPWADPAVMAEQMGGRYVFARKPNPANVAIQTDPEVIRREIEETVQLCIRYGFPCEFVLKDISTVSYKPENLMIWADTVSDVLDQYYDKA